MEKKTIIHLPMQYFAEDVPAEAGDQPAGEAEKPAEKSFTRDDVNRMIAAEKKKEREAAEREFQERQAESERLAKMKEEERTAYEKQQAEERASRAEAELNAYKLKSEAAKIASASELPLEFLDNIDFQNSTAEQVSERLGAMTKQFNAAIEARVNQKLKQNPPETHAPSAGTAGYEKLLEEARGRNDTMAIAYYTRLMAEQQKG